MALVDHQKILAELAKKTPQLSIENMQKLQANHHEALQGAKRLREDGESEVPSKKQRNKDQCTTCEKEIPDEYKEQLCDKCYCSKYQLENPLEDDNDDCEVKDLDNETSPSAEETKADAAKIEQSDDDDEHRKVFDRMLSYLDRGSISMTDFNRYLKSVNNCV